jgi:hypothetical protein
MTVWLPQQMHDRIVHLAKRNDTSVSTIAKTLINLGFSVAVADARQRRNGQRRP